jgi:hypothetical protein
MPDSGRVFRRCASAGPKILYAQTAERPAEPSFRKRTTKRGTSKQSWSRQALRLFGYSARAQHQLPLCILRYRRETLMTLGQLATLASRELVLIDKEVESATIGRSRKATEALAAQRRPSGI